MDTVMVIDPDESDYRLVAEHARLLDVSLMFIPTGAEALACKLANRKIIAWLINIQLPDMTGLELVDFLRQRRTQVPVLMVDNHYSMAREVTVLATGRLHYLYKPLDCSWLDAVVAQKCLSGTDCSADNPPPAFSTFAGTTRWFH